MINKNLTEIVVLFYPSKEYKNAKLVVSGIFPGGDWYVVIVTRSSGFVD